jgi:branched-chain amino acid transport system substrate-binding protein
MALKKWLSVFVGAGALMIATACGSSGPSSSGGSSSAHTPQTVVIGDVTDLTGAGGPFGQADVRMAQLAIKDVNASQSKYHFQLVVKDDQSTPQGAVTAMQQLLTTPHLGAIIGGVLTDNVAAMMPLIKKSGLPAVMTVQGLPGRGPNVFATVVPTNNLQPLTVTQVLVPKHVKTFAAIYQQESILTASLSDMNTAAKSAGIQDVYQAGGPITQTSFGTQVSIALSHHPGAIFLDCFPNVSGTIAAQLRSRGYNGLLIGQAGVSNAAFSAAAGKAAAGVIVPVQWSLAGQNASSKKVVAQYTSTYPKAPPLSFDNMGNWDAIHILLQAIGAAGSTKPAAVVSQLTSLTYNGVIGDNLKFSPSTGIITSSGYLVEYDASGNQSVYNG